nr:MAG TPA: hypothetical protein [Bacteriophage sp.]
MHCLTCLCVIKLPRPYNTAVRQERIFVFT